MTVNQSILIGFALIALAFVFAFALLALIAFYTLRRRVVAPPSWPRMLAEPTYFRHAMIRIFQARGYAVVHWREHRDPLERQVREVVFVLRRGGAHYPALCGRWVIPITSEVITRFEHALAATRARTGLIVTTSWFSDAALERARGLPVELHDGARLQAWIADAWG